jgi:hypothetical protein
MQLPISLAKGVLAVITKPFLTGMSKKAIFFKAKEV